MLGQLEAHVAEGAAAILALVDAIAIRNAALIIVFAGAHPDDRRILGVDRDPTDGIRSIVVENRSPGGPVVDRQENVARGFGHQVVAGAVGEHGDLRNSAGDHGWADLPGAQARESAAIDGVLIASAAAAAGLRGLILRDGGKGTTQKDWKQLHGGSISHGRGR